MSEIHRIEIEFDDRCYEALLGEADRLHMDVEHVVARAAAAWLVEIAETASSLTCNPTVTLVS
jgi:hypothetical protein